MLTKENLLKGFLDMLQSLGSNFSTIKTFLFLVLILVIIIFIVTILSFLVLNNMKKNINNSNNNYLAKSNYNRRRVLYK